MGLYETRILMMRDADMNIHILREENGELFEYTDRGFFALLCHPHMNLYIVADISDSVIRDDSNIGPFGCEAEQNIAIESWERLLDFGSYLCPHSPESAPVFLSDFNRIWNIAEREGLIKKE